MIELPDTLPEVPAGFVTFVVTCDTPNGPMDVELGCSSGPGAAARRAFMALVSAGHGDLDEIQVLSVQVGAF